MSISITESTKTLRSRPKTQYGPSTLAMPHDYTTQRLEYGGPWGIFHELSGTFVTHLAVIFAG